MVNAKFILTVEKHRNLAEGTLKVGKQTLAAHIETDDMYDSVIGLVDKLEKQAKKIKNKFNNRRKKDTYVRVDVLDSKEKEETTPKVVRSSNYMVRPMTTEDAVSALNDVRNDFLLYRNLDTDEVAVIYRRNDGNFGLIEPGVLISKVNGALKG